MNKKTITLILTTLLAVMGVKADVIPSSYYSEPAQGTFYIYNVTEGKFLMTAGISENNNALQTNPQAVTLTSNSDGTYKFSGNAGCFVKIGHFKGMWLWPSGTDTNVLSWTFNVEGTKTYKISATTTSTVSENGGTKEPGTYYIINEGNLGDKDDAANAGVYALITEASYYSYIASTTATIPASFYTTTITAGTYYLYNTYTNCFLCDGNNYAGLSSTPETITITATGDNYYIQVSDGGYLHYSDQGKDLGNTWADNTSDQTWNFESFHGATGLFTVKNVTNNLYLYAYSSGPANKGAQLWGTVDSNKYAWALISTTDYETNVTLNDTENFSPANDIFAANVTVNRAMTANVWNTLVVPFDMAIPSGWTVKEPTAFDGSTLTFGDASSIVAGKPYIVKPTEAVTSFSATNVTLKKDLANTEVGDVTMKGTYEYIDAIDHNSQTSYVVGLKNGATSLYKVNSAVSLKPFRAYFTVSGNNPGARVAIRFDDDTTGINVLEEESANENTGMKDGKYLENGRIIIVKNGVKYSTNGQIAK